MNERSVTGRVSGHVYVIDGYTSHVTHSVADTDAGRADRITDMVLRDDRPVKHHGRTVERTAGQS